MKTDLLLTQTRRRLPAYSESEIRIEPIAKGGSDRRFYRVRCRAAQSLILVKYNRERQENAQYAAVAEFLEAHGIHAPKIYFHDQEEGLIWIEDLGECDLFHFRSEPWSVRRPLYHSALRQIARLHEVAETEWAELRAGMPPEFNGALYEWEQRYFFENCLGRIFRLPKKQIAEIGALPALTVIAEHLASLPRRLVHRDFQSQNIIIRNDDAYLIDFQGMRPGLPEYDLASLLFDPYVSLGAAERAELCGFYNEIRIGGGSDCAETLRLCAMQRLMQALGAYGYLGLVKGSRQFLAHVPAALRSLRTVLAEVKGLEPLGAALASLHENAPVGQ